MHHCVFHFFTPATRCGGARLTAPRPFAACDRCGIASGVAHKPMVLARQHYCAEVSTLEVSVHPWALSYNHGRL